MWWLFYHSESLYIHKIYCVFIFPRIALRVYVNDKWLACCQHARLFVVPCVRCTMYIFIICRTKVHRGYRPKAHGMIYFSVKLLKNICRKRGIGICIYSIYYILYTIYAYCARVDAAFILILYVCTVHVQRVPLWNDLKYSTTTRERCYCGGDLWGADGYAFVLKCVFFFYIIRKPIRLILHLPKGKGWV